MPLNTFFAGFDERKIKGIPFGIRQQTNFAMLKDKNIQSNHYGDEAPGWKDVLIVLIIVVVLIAFAWIAYYKFGWLH